MEVQTGSKVEKEVVERSRERSGRKKWLNNTRKGIINYIKSIILNEK